MSSMIPRQRTRRVASSLLGAALTTGVLAVGAAGDGIRPGASQPQAAGAPTTDEGGAPPRGGPGAESPPEEGAPGMRGPQGGALPASGIAESRLAEAVQPLMAGTSARLAVSVLEPASGAEVAYGSGRFETASIVKVNVVAALLLHARDEGRDLTAQERSLTREAIRRSDNDATHDLWTRIGREDGLAAVNERLGLSVTRPGGGGHWGLTRTTAADQITLLTRIFGGDSPLHPDDRDYLRELMGSVNDEQAWGVSAAAPGSPAALKNGWLPRTTTDLWTINSIGRVTVAGTEYLVAVLSSGHETSEDGIAVVESAARSAIEVIRESPVA